MNALEGIDVDPADARVLFLLKLAMIRPLAAEEALELAQLQAAEKAEPLPQEVLQ
jgi:hypothetical protein